MQLQTYINIPFHPSQNDKDYENTTISGKDALKHSAYTLLRKMETDLAAIAIHLENFQKPQNRATIRKDSKKIYKRYRCTSTCIATLITVTKL